MASGPTRTTRGVAPLVGVLLLIGVVIGLAAIVQVAVLNVGNSTPHAVMADAQITQSVDGEYVVEPTQMGNAEELRVLCGDSEYAIESADEQVTIETNCGGSLQVIAATPNKTELIRQTEPRSAEVDESPLLAEEHALYVTVEDQHGNELSDADIRVSGEEYTDPHIVPPGEYVVTAEKDGFETDERRVTYTSAAKYVTIDDEDAFVTLVLERNVTTSDDDNGRDDTDNDDGRDDTNNDNGRDDTEEPPSEEKSPDECSGNSSSTVNQSNKNTGGDNVDQSNKAKVDSDGCGDVVIDQVNENHGGDDVDQSNSAKVRGGGNVRIDQKNVNNGGGNVKQSNSAKVIGGENVWIRQTNRNR